MCEIRLHKTNYYDDYYRHAIEQKQKCLKICFDRSTEYCMHANKIEERKFNSETTLFIGFQVKKDNIGGIQKVEKTKEVFIA